jgi:hypothetical protein
VRALTVPIKKLTKSFLAEQAMLYPGTFARPQTRADCADIPRPCPFVGCVHNLYLDVNEDTGSIKLNFPDLEPWELPHSCSLDEAGCGEHTLDQVGALMNITRERVRQLEERLFDLLAQDAQLVKLHEVTDDDSDRRTSERDSQRRRQEARGRDHQNGA